jgi:hypothetical protein
MDYDWLEKHAMLLDAKLQSVAMDKHMDENIRAKLQDRLLQRSIDETVQMGLDNFINTTIDDFASENPVLVTKTTQTMIFIVIRLFSNLYSHANKSSMK